MHRELFHGHQNFGHVFSMRYFYLFLHMPKKMLVFVNFMCTYNVEMYTGFF
jgi:hypothetical protein